MTKRGMTVAELLAVVLLSASGCGRIDTDVSWVSGEIVYDDQPVSSGLVSFEPAEGQGPSLGIAIYDGRYEGGTEAAMKPGKYLVRITGSVSSSNAKVAAGPDDAVPSVPLLPSEWNTKSVLTVDVEPGKNVVNVRGKKGALPRVDVSPIDHGGRVGVGEE